MLHICFRWYNKGDSIVVYIRLLMTLLLWVLVNLSWSVAVFAGYVVILCCRPKYFDCSMLRFITEFICISLISIAPILFCFTFSYTILIHRTPWVSIENQNPWILMFCSKTNLTQCNFPVTKMKLNFQKLKSETTETFICKCSPEQIFENQESSKGYIYNGAPFC